MKKTTIRLEEVTIKKLNRIAKKEKVSSAQLIREAVEYLITTYERNEKRAKEEAKLIAAEKKKAKPEPKTTSKPKVKEVKKPAKKNK